MKPDATNKSSSRTITVIALVVIACAICVALYSAAGNWMERARAKNLKNPVAPSPEALAEGKQLYGQHCENCHGERGDGKGEKAAELSTAPTDFTDVQKMAGVSDGELYWQITKGRKPMPAFEDKLTDQQRWESVDFLRTFASKPAADPSSAPPSQR